MSREQAGEAPGRGRLAGRKILVVGGGQDERGQINPPVGNGRAISMLFAREGAHVAVADRSRDAAEKTAALIAKEGGRAVVLTVDVADPVSVRAMTESAAEAMGGLDGFVFNAGIVLGGLSLAALSDEDWRRSTAINLDSAFFVTRAALPVFSSGSSCVYVSSLTGRLMDSRAPAYDAAKAGLEGLMRHVAIEGAARGIRANVVLPGWINAVAAGAPPPIGRPGTGWDVAYAALFLTSGEAANVTGQVLAIDGGSTALR